MKGMSHKPGKDERDEEEGQRERRARGSREERARTGSLREERERAETGRTQSRVGPLPPSVIAAHMMEDWIPHGRFDISSVVFIQTGARAAVVATNL